MEICQNALIIFSSKYNESVSGKDFWIPLVSEIGLQFCRLFTRNSLDASYSAKKLIIRKGFFMPISDNHRKENLHKIMDEPYVMWKYFFNKAKYSFDTYDNLECIINSAISLEAYLQEQIRKYNLNDNLDKFIQENSIKNISFFQITKFLRLNTVFTKEEENFINKIFGKISGMRNSIIHGKITTPILSRQNANIAKLGIVELYSRFENITENIDDIPKLPLEYYFNKSIENLNK